MKISDLKEPQRKYDIKLVGQGYDTIVETLSMMINHQTWARLEHAKQYAREHNNGSNQAYTTKLGGMDFQIKPHGSEGKAFLLSNDLYLIDIATANTDYNISIKYRACVLWQYGVEEARRIIYTTLLKELRSRPQPKSKKGGWQKISKADYAFDFYSPEFSKEIDFSIADRVVCHSSCKTGFHFKGPEVKDTEEDLNGYIIGRGRRVQTLNIGNKKRTEIQLYDKCAEIKARAGKYWFYEVWKQSGYTPPKDLKGKDIWRIEVRFGREYFNEQGIEDFDDLEKSIGTILKKALSSRRIVDRSPTDKNIRRWATNALWYEAYKSCFSLGDMIPIGKQEDYMCVQAMEHKDMQDLKALIRRVAVRECGDFDKNIVEHFLLKVLEEAPKDENHDEAIERYQEKFKFIRHAR